MKHSPINLPRFEKALLFFVGGIFALVACITLAYFGYIWLYAPEAPTFLPVLSAPANNAPKDCNCSGDILSCADFTSQDQAQQCFNYCRAWGKGDVYNLDRDNDLLACESLNK